MLGLEFGEKVLWKSPAGAKMEKINARWGYGLFVGVKAKSNELIIVERDTNCIKYVRTVRRVPLEQRCSVHNLEWVRAVPYRCKEDEDADGDVPEWTSSKAQGGRCTVHRAHLTKQDFQKFGVTNQCPGCSAIIRGLRVQLHAAHCRRKMEKHLENDLRVQTAKLRLSERSRKLREEQGPEVHRKRRKLDDIEDAVINEDDLQRLATL